MNDELQILGDCGDAVVQRLMWKNTDVRGFTPLEKPIKSSRRLESSDGLEPVFPTRSTFLTGFTLIELLVVISIIALLMSILIPVISRAKEQAKRSICLHNESQIMAAWNMYANDNKDKLVNTQPYKVYCAWATGGAICPGGAAYQPGECGSNPDCGYNIYYREGQIGWIAWPHLWNTNTSPSTGSKDPPHSYCPGIKEIDATEADWQHGVACGGLWKYIRDFSLYRCPVGEKRAYVTYTGSSMMNGHYAHKFCEPLQSYSYRNRNQIKKPAMRMAFLDIGAVTCYSWDIAIAKNPSGGPCNPGYFGWLNPPPLRHGKGTTMSFADGHCEYRKWVDSRTQSGDLSCNQDCNKDIFYMQRIVCGGLNPEEIAAIPAGCKTE